MKNLIESFKEEGRWSREYVGDTFSTYTFVYTDNVRGIEIGVISGEAIYKGATLPHEVFEAIRGLDRSVAAEAAKAKQEAHDKTLSELEALYT